MKKAYILDSTAFYADIPFNSTITYFTTPNVIEEVFHGTIRKTSIESYIEIGRLKIITPSSENIRNVRNSSVKTGDILKLSKTDITVLALALQFKKDKFDVSVVSDDFMVENSTIVLGMKIVPVMTQGISKVINWKTYCIGCGKVFIKKNLKSCDICGTKLKQKFNYGKNPI